MTSHSNTTFPIQLDTTRSACHLFLVIVGLPLNIFVAVVIISFQRLHKPRNILWLGVTIANSLTLLTILFEFFASHLQSETVCKIFISVTGIAYTWLLFNLLLALIDRYLAIVHTLAHRKKVTVKRVIITQTIGFVIIVFLIKFHFITGLVPLTCADKIPEHSKIIAISNILLVSKCLIAHVVVYLKSKRYFNKPEGRELTVAFTRTSSSGAINSSVVSTDHWKSTVLINKVKFKCILIYLIYFNYYI